MDERIIPLLERIANALERLANDGKPAAPNLTRPMEEFWNFDWASIGAEIVKDDHDGPTHVQHNGLLYTRRSPSNKFEPAIWYSAPAGKDEEGNTAYVRLITFKAFGDADPLPGKLAGAAKPNGAAAQGRPQGNPQGNPQPAPPAQKPASRPYTPDVLKVQLGQWAKTRLGQPCTPQHRALLAGQLEAVLGGKFQRYELSEWLLGSQSTSDISCEMVLAALKDWLLITGWDSQPNEAALAEIKAAHAAAVAHIKATQKA